MATASASAEVSAVPPTQPASALLKCLPLITDQEPAQRYYLTATFLFPRNFISIPQGWGVPHCLPKRRNKWEKRGRCLHLFEEQPLTFAFWGREERNGVCPTWGLFGRRGPRSARGAGAAPPPASLRWARARANVPGVRSHGGEAAAGSGDCNSQKALREDAAPTANQRPRCCPINGHRGPPSASVCDGGRGPVRGPWCRDNPPPSALYRASPAARPRHMDATGRGRSDGLRRGSAAAGGPWPGAWGRCRARRG